MCPYPLKIARAVVGVDLLMLESKDDTSSFLCSEVASEGG